ncbi:MAG: hypothetical protein VKP63_08620 [Cyanobacteriota bacterium]|nr:hypothetical protein [Cyanobacteriota bacterium]
MLPPLRFAVGVSAPPQPPPGLDIWAWISAGVQRHGPLGSVVVVALSLMGYALSQVQHLA